MDIDTTAMPNNSPVLSDQLDDHNCDRGLSPRAHPCHNLDIADQLDPQGDSGNIRDTASQPDSDDVTSSGVAYRPHSSPASLSGFDTTGAGPKYHGHLSSAGSTPYHYGPASFAMESISRHELVMDLRNKILELEEVTLPSLLFRVAH